MGRHSALPMAPGPVRLIPRESPPVTDPHLFDVPPPRELPPVTDPNLFDLPLPPPVVSPPTRSLDRPMLPVRTPEREAEDGITDFEGPGPGLEPVSVASVLRREQDRSHEAPRLSGRSMPIGRAFGR